MKKILASILAVVLLGTMAISGFAAETAEPAADAALLIAEDTAIVSGTAQTGINEDGTVAQVTSDGHVIITVSEKDVEDGEVDVPVTVWEGCDITVILPEGYEGDGVTLKLPLTPKTRDLGWGIVGLIDPETEDEVILQNTFDENNDIVIFNAPAETPFILKDRAVKFDDVPEDAWYAKYFDYASAHGYIVGNGDGTVEPEAPVTDAALYALLLRLIDKGEDTFGNDWELGAYNAANEEGFYSPLFADGDMPRGHAMTIVSKFLGPDANAVEDGIFIGDGNGNLDEGSPLTRAQLGVIAKRLVEFINNYEVQI